jgi:hypothetical protein
MAFAMLTVTVHTFHFSTAAVLFIGGTSLRSAFDFATRQRLTQPSLPLFRPRAAVESEVSDLRAAFRHHLQPDTRHHITEQV